MESSKYGRHCSTMREPITQFLPVTQPTARRWMLGVHDVHIWLVDLDQPDAAQVQQFTQMLDPAEQQRAARFRFEHDQRHFTVARGMLRQLLGMYLACAGSTIQFSYGPRGKPALAPPFDEQQLHFNVSHSHGLALYALTHRREVGVDLEYMRPLNDAEAIAERFFSEQERAALHSVPALMRHQAFFNCWTRKEAYIKATGDGLSMPLDQFAVSLAPGEPARLLHVAPGALEAAHWSLQALAPATDYVGSVVVEGHDWELACWRWID